MRAVSHRRRLARGNALIEFTLVGIPIMFVLISVFEVSRAFWQYDTFGHALREGARYASVHSNNCGVFPNFCTTSVADVADRIMFQGAGIWPPDVQQVEFIWGDADTGTVAFTCTTLENCLSGGSQRAAAAAMPWPEGQPGGMASRPVTIRAEYQFRTAIAMFWPGSAPVSVGAFELPASSTEMVHY